MIVRISGDGPKSSEYGFFGIPHRKKYRKPENKTNRMSAYTVVWDIKSLRLYDGEKMKDNKPNPKNYRLLIAREYVRLIRKDPV